MSMSNAYRLIRGREGLVAVIRGRYVSSFALDLPNLPDQKLNKIIPSILTDKLAAGMEDQHYALLDQGDVTFNKESRIVLVCDDEIMKQIQADVQQRGDVLAAAWPDYMALNEGQGDGLTVFRQGENLLCRQSDGTGYSIEHKFAKLLHGERKIDYVEILNVADYRSYPEGVGLARGHYGRQVPMISYLVYLRRLALLALAVMMMWGVKTYNAISQNESQIRAYQDHAEALFKQRYPEVKRIVNVQAQLRTKIAQGGGHEDDVLGHIDQLHQVLNELDNVRLESLRMNGQQQGQVTITVATADYNALAQLRQAMTERGYAMAEGGSRQDKGQILSEMSIRSKRP